MKPTHYINKHLGADIRAITKDGEPWFVLRDLCKVLGHSNPTQAVKDHLDDDEYSKLSLGKGPWSLIVNESGLFTLILKSQKPEARPIRKWVTSEVLPAIRKHGRYDMAETKPQFDAATQALLPLFAEPEQKQAAKDFNAKMAEKAKMAKTSAARACSKGNWRRVRRITGKYPKEWRAKARKAGLKSVVYNSGKGSVRVFLPVKGAVIALADSLSTEGGYPEQAADDVALAAEPALKHMAMLGAPSLQSPLQLA